MARGGELAGAVGSTFSPITRIVREAEADYEKGRAKFGKAEYGVYWRNPTEGLQHALSKLESANTVVIKLGPNFEREIPREHVRKLIKATSELYRMSDKTDSQRQILKAILGTNIMYIGRYTFSKFGNRKMKFNARNLSYWRKSLREADIEVA